MAICMCEIFMRLKLPSLVLLTIEFKTQIRSKSNGNFFILKINFVFRLVCFLPCKGGKLLLIIRITVLITPCKGGKSC